MSLFGGGDETEDQPPVENPSRTSIEAPAAPIECSVDVDLVEEVSGMEEIIESVNCAFWAGYMTPDDDPEAQCRGVLSDLRIEDSDVVLLKMKTRDGETVAECR